jgi:site-specific DNA recombinase
MDRLARNLKLLLELWDQLEGYGVHVVILEYGIDTSTPAGRLIRNVLASIAEFERDTIISRTRSGRRQGVRQGSVYRRQILGYRCIRADKKNGQLAGVEIDEEGAVLVRRIFTSAVSGVSLHELARQLNAEGVPTLRGGCMWRAATVQKIVLNPIYTGQAAYGRWTHVQTPRERQRAGTPEGKVTQTTVRADPATIDYAPAPPIISPELAAAAQAALGRNRALARRNAHHDFLVGGGLLRCGVLLEDGTICGHAMHGEHRAARRPLYRCCHTTPNGPRRHNVPVARVDQTVWTAVRDTLSDPSTVLDDLRALSDAGSAQAAEAEAELRTIERATTAIDQQRDTLLNLHLAGVIDRARFTEKDAALQGKQQALADQAAVLVARRAAALAQQLPVTQIEELCAELAGRLDTLTFAQRQHVVRLLVSSVSTDGHSVHLAGAFDVLSMTVALGEPDATGHNPQIATTRL